ncbi:MAG: hypothetical protein ACYSYM_14260, partial [Planctomycetota bacterium]
MKETFVMKTTSSLFQAILTLALPACTLLADDLILIEDFEAATYEEWTVNGDAFGKGPVEEDMVGVLGSRSAAST